MIYDFLWGDLITVPLPGDSSLGLSLLVIILIPAGIFCMIITRFLPVRMFPEMIRISMEKRNEADKDRSVSGIEALIVSTATRVGMGNLVGVVAAVSAGGAGAIFWMWLAVVIGSAPCAAASADVDHPVKSGLLQSLGVFIDTIIICSCTAFVMLLVPEEMVSGLSGMDLLQEAMRYHFGKAGVIFIAVTLWLF
nr:alanine:cation symporter family protein [Lachnospiraceae bacterium]